MNLRDLEYFVATADELHFGRAALRCHVSQPTLSMQLKKLEDTLGVQLFERSNKRVMLTTIGEALAVRARRALGEVTQIRELAKSTRNPLAGEMRIGLFPTLAPYLLPSLMPQLKTRFPLLNIRLIEEKTPELIVQLEAGTLDCALLAMPVTSELLDAYPCFTEPFLLGVAAGHRLAKRRYVALSDLNHESMLLLEDGHCLREQALDVCRTIGIGEANNFRATSLETLRHMVASSDAVTLIPKLAVQPGDRTMCYIPFKAPAPARTIGLYARKTSARVPLFEALAACIRRDYARL